jgi:hypothetical protein
MASPSCRPSEYTITLPQSHKETKSDYEAHKSDPVYKTLETVLQHTCKKILENEQLLTQLDQKVGDGDLGISMSAGSKGILEAMKNYPLHDPSAAFHQVALTLQDKLGGIYTSPIHH